MLEEATGRRRTASVEAAGDDAAAKKAARLGFAVVAVRREDVYDQLWDAVRRAFTCRNCAGRKLLPGLRWCSACRARERAQLREARERARTVVETQVASRRRVVARRWSTGQSNDGSVLIGPDRVPAHAIYAIEPWSNDSLFKHRSKVRYGWTVHFFYRPSHTVSFPTVEEAEGYYGYLLRSVPGLKLIRRQEVWFWWVSF